MTGITPMTSAPGHSRHAMRGIVLSFAASIVTALPIPASADPGTPDCARLVHLRLEDAEVLSAKAIEAGNFKLTDGEALPKLGAFCRVVAHATPSADSDIRFEVWLPAQDWNRRLWAFGNGWFGGYIQERALAARVGAGYVAVMTDTGHASEPTDTAWANGHPEKVIDYGHRAIHLMTVHAKRIAEELYDQAPAHAYFASCSNGGRAALMEAQRYPQDYDGIIAGAPVVNLTQFYLSAGIMKLQWLATGPGYLPAKKLPAIHAAVLSACDSIDGIKDGIIDDPRRCRFDPTVLACQGAEADDCLTEGQVGTLRKLYSGAALPSGMLVYPGFALGSEFGWAEALIGDSPGAKETDQAVVGFFRNVVFENDKWDPHNFNAEQAAILATRKLASALDAANPDLSKFIARGGKLIIFQGWADALQSAQRTVDYYRRVVESVGATSAGSAVRLFMAPGMDHCAGGDGPNEFGQFGGGTGDPELRLGAALQRWVEGGIAPEKIIATKHKDDEDPASEVVRTRPLCAYPLVARYGGKGSVDNAASFDCLAPP